MRTANRILLFLIIIIYFFVCNGANSQPLTGRPLLSAESSRASTLDGVIVDTIVIDNRNIFDTDTEQYHHLLFKTANKLHYKTRRQVIQREVLLEVGQPYSSDLAEETARNLRQRLPLYDAWVETKVLANGHLLVRVVTIDEWSLSGGLTVSRDGNETQYKLGVKEKNLLGNNQLLSAKYYIQPSEKNYLVTAFTDRRLFGKPYAVVLKYSNNPLDKFGQISLAHPFYNLSQSSSFEASLAVTSGRRDVYNDSLMIGRSWYEGDWSHLAYAYRLGSYLRKVEFRPQYLYRYERTFDTTTIATNPAERRLAAESFPDDSLYHQVGMGVNLMNLDFLKLRWIDGFGYTEDFVLGQVFRVGLARAWTRNFTGVAFDVFDVGFSEAIHHGTSLALFTYKQEFWFKEGKDIRTTTRLSANYYHRPFSFLTLAVRGAYMSDRRADGSETVVLGGKKDIRGYDTVFETGDRKGVLNLEGRFYPNLELLSFLFEGVFFTDLGRSWKVNESLKLRDFYMSAGVGLRIALTRTSKNKLLRIDLAYSEKYQWQLSIGTDQYFSAQDGGFFLTSP